MFTVTAITSRIRLSRVVGALAVTAAVAASQATIGVSNAEATPQRVCAVVEVPESSYSVYVKTLRPYESVTVTPGGRIWAGVWFTGENGPAGWNVSAPWYFPRPGARQYSLLAGLSGETWRYMGGYAYTFYNNSPYSRALFARVNDNVPGNGSGAFTLQYCYYTG
jgi:hypothetical protein